MISTVTMVTCLNIACWVGTCCREKNLAFHPIDGTVVWLTHRGLWGGWEADPTGQATPLLLLLLQLHVVSIHQGITYKYMIENIHLYYEWKTEQIIMLHVRKYYNLQLAQRKKEFQVLNFTGSQI